MVFKFPKLLSGIRADTSNVYFQKYSLPYKLPFVLRV